MRVYNRKLEIYNNLIEPSENKLNTLYKTIAGRILLKTIFIRPWFNKLVGAYYNSSFSISKIKDSNKQNYSSFNDYFTRKREIINHLKYNELPAIADSKLLCYNLDNKFNVNIKGSIYTFDELVNSDKYKEYFENGKCLVFRLGINDYHRYYYPDSGIKIYNKKFKGVLHTIRPISSKYKVFHRNSKEVTLINTSNFGKIYIIEIGAMLVGKICNNRVKEFNKLQEKGHFEFGGSTIVMITNKDIIIDADIVKQSKLDIKTLVEVGDKIGIIK